MKTAPKTQRFYFVDGYVFSVIEDTVTGEILSCSFESHLDILAEPLS